MSSRTSSRTLAVAAGKGGAGSTFFAVNLAVSLSRLDRSVLIVDVSRFGGGVPSIFGQPYRANKSVSRHSLGGFDLKHHIISTDLKRISYVQSFADDWSATPVKDSGWAVDYLNICRNSGFDFVIFDIGTDDSTQGAFLFNGSDGRILLSTPEATSIEKSYRFLESVSLQSLVMGHGPEMAGLIKTGLDEFRQTSKNGTVSMLDFIQQRLPTLDGIDQLRERNIQIVINHCRARSDYDLGPAIQSALRKYYGFKANSLGCLDADNAVLQASRNQEPVLVGQPFAFVSGQFLTMSRNLLQLSLLGNFDSIRLKSVI